MITAVNKRIFIIIFIILPVVNAYPSESVTSTERTDFLLFRGGVNNIESSEGPSLSVIFGHRFNQLIDLGIGARRDPFENYSLASAFLHGRVLLSRSRNIPFISVDIGYTMPAPVTDEWGGFLVCGGAGISGRLSPALGIAMGVDIRSPYTRASDTIIRYYTGLDWYFRGKIIKTPTPEKPIDYANRKTTLRIRGGLAVADGHPGFSVVAEPSFRINKLINMGIGFESARYDNGTLVSFFLSGRGMFTRGEWAPFLACGGGYYEEIFFTFTSKSVRGPLLSIGLGFDSVLAKNKAIIIQFDHITRWSKGYLITNYNIFRFSGGIAF